MSVACDEVKEYPWNPDWDQYEPDVEDDDRLSPFESETPKSLKQFTL